MSSWAMRHPAETANKSASRTVNGLTTELKGHPIVNAFMLVESFYDKSGLVLVNLVCIQA